MSCWVIISHKKTFPNSAICESAEENVHHIKLECFESHQNKQMNIRLEEDEIIVNMNDHVLKLN